MRRFKVTKPNLRQDRQQHDNGVDKTQLLGFTEVDEVVPKRLQMPHQRLRLCRFGQVPQGQALSDPSQHHLIASTLGFRQILPSRVEAP